MIKILISAMLAVACAVALCASPQDKSEHNKDNTVHHEAMHDEHAVHHAAVHAENWVSHHVSAPHKKVVTHKMAVHHKKSIHHKKKSMHKSALKPKPHGN